MRSSPRCAGPPMAARRCSSPTASPPCAKPIGSSSSIRGALPSRGRMPSSWNSGGSTPSWPAGRLWPMSWRTPMSASDGARREAVKPPSEPEVERLYQPKLDRVVLARLLAYARPYRGRIILAVALLLLVSAGELLFPYLTKQAIDIHIAAKDLAGLAHLSLLYLGLLVVVFVV